MKELHLIANAHIDPVWQWDWQEGVGVALSTFAAAADLCEEYPDFVFNHNEAVLYQWVEHYDPPLFERIRRLVREGRWHIMGGWYIQSDCNLPEGESILRQIRRGRLYFREKFGVEPTVAASLDAFGHSRGLVQLLQQAGYTGYCFMRAAGGLPEQLRWEGYAGSEVAAVRLLTCYNTPLGGSAPCVEDYLNAMPENATHFRFWGVGNHGGGPSRKDLEDLKAMEAQVDDRLLHSTPERYFSTLDVPQLPVVANELGPVFVGTYVSMQRVKKLHRRLEAQLYTAEAMAALAAIHSGDPYPRETLQTVEDALLFSQFHDILPGTCVETAEEGAIQRLHTGLQLAQESQLKSLYALCRQERPAAPGDTPLFVFQPLAQKQDTYFECEFMLPDQNWSGEYSDVTVRCDGKEVPAQIIKEESNLNLDWRKRIGILAPLTPLGITRLDVSLKSQKEPLRQVQVPKADRLTVSTDWGEVVVDCQNGTLVSLKHGDSERVAADCGRLYSYIDNEDPWSMQEPVLGCDPQAFRLLTGEALREFTGRAEVPAVSVLEQGVLLTRIQVLLGQDTARACVQYTVFHRQPFVDVDIRLFNTAPGRLYRLSLPVAAPKPDYYGQDICGARSLRQWKVEQLIHEWVAVRADRELVLGVVNDSSASVSIRNGRLEATLLRVPAYTAHPLTGRPLLKDDCFLPHVDQGSRRMRFRLLPALCSEAELDREARSFNAPPLCVPIFPRGAGSERPALEVTGARVMALRAAEDGNGYIVRLFRNAAEDGETVVTWPAMGIYETRWLKGYQVQTLRITAGRCTPCTVLEDPEPDAVS